MRRTKTEAGGGEAMRKTKSERKVGFAEIAQAEQEAEAKKAEAKLEQKLAAEWELTHGKEVARRTAAELATKQHVTAKDYFKDMAQVEKLMAREVTEDDPEAKDFEAKVAQRTAAERAKVAQVTLENYEADKAAEGEVEAIEAKVNAQLHVEEGIILDAHKNDRVLSDGTIQQVSDVSAVDNAYVSPSQKAADLASLVRSFEAEMPKDSLASHVLPSSWVA